ncbi:hypothetical protein ACHAXT_004939 [Thalassiosira profunda]
MSNKRGSRRAPRPPRQRQAPASVDEEWSPSELRANAYATVLCWCLMGCLPRILGWPLGIIGYVLYLPVVLIVGKGLAYAALFLIGVLFAAYVKWIWRLPMSEDLALLVDEANAILFPDSGEAREVARRRCCEIDHLVWTCSNLEDGMKEVQKVTGVKPQMGGKHPEFGTHNALLSLGNGAYLEIIAVDPDRGEDAARIPTIFGLDEPSNMNKLVAFAVHPNPSVRGATFELIAQSMHLARYKIGGIATGKRQSPDGQLLQWKFTSPLCANFAQAFVIDWGKARSPAQTAPKGCMLQKLVFFCSGDELKRAREMHWRMGLVDSGGRIPVAVEETDGPSYMVAEILTPKGRKVVLGQGNKKAS